MKKLFVLLVATLMSLNIWADEQGYAIFDESTGILTFKYGEKPEGENVYDTDNTPIDRDGVSDWLKNSWHIFGGDILKVIIEESFQNAKPRSGSFWFYQCPNITEIVGLENLNTSEMKSMLAMFESCESLQRIDVSHFDTRNVTNMQSMFKECEALTELDCSHFDTRYVKRMDSMFSGCINLERLNIDNFNTELVVNMRSMFYNCVKLKVLNVTSFNTANVEDMMSMFRFCESIEELDLSHFITDKVTDMSTLIDGCRKLRYADLSYFNTKNVTDLNYMFANCDNLEYVDLSSFDTGAVTDMGHMFTGCDVLTTIYVGSSWNTKNVTSGEGMFYNCEKIVGGKGTRYDKKHTDVEYARIDGGTSAPGYLTYKESGTISPEEPEPMTPEFGGKHIKTITWTDGKDTEVGELKYDEDGRIKEYLIDGKSRDKYAYSDNSITITESGDTYEYTISNGRVVSGKTSLDGGEIDIDRTFSYNLDGQLASIVNKEKERGYSEVYTIIESWEWRDSNLSMWTLLDDEDTETSLFTYNSITTEPMMRALFGFGQERHLDDFYELLAIYPYMGKLPNNLFERIKHRDAEDREWEYNYTYDQNANGDIAKVTISFKDKTYVYTFEWEGSDDPSAIKDIVVSPSEQHVYYNLNGQKVITPVKGIYIKNGKKVIVK